MKNRQKEGAIIVWRWFLCWREWVLRDNVFVFWGVRKVLGNNVGVLIGCVRVLRDCEGCIFFVVRRKR